MAKITLDGVPCETIGNLPAIGILAPDFTLTKTDLTDFKLSDYRGKKILLNIFPSIMTGVCAASARNFSKKIEHLENVTAFCISKDLPFTHHQFCEAEGIINIIMASQYKNTSFSDLYEVTITSGAFEGLFSRAVIILDEEGKVIYTEQVPDIGQEPNYEQAYEVLSK